MAAECEIAECGVLAVGRCGACSQAFCRSHEFDATTCRACGAARHEIVCEVCGERGFAGQSCHYCGRTMCSVTHPGEGLDHRGEGILGIRLRSWVERTCPDCMVRLPAEQLARQERARYEAEEPQRRVVAAARVLAERGETPLPRGSSDLEPAFAVGRFGWKRGDEGPRPRRAATGVTVGGEIVLMEPVADAVFDGSVEAVATTLERIVAGELQQAMPLTAAERKAAEQIRRKLKVFGPRYHHLKRIYGDRPNINEMSRRDRKSFQTGEALFAELKALDPYGLSE